MQITTTPRLVLREVVLQDAPFVLGILNTPGWLRFIGDRNVHDIAAAEEYIRSRFQFGYQTYGYGIYAIELTDGTLIGLGGLVKRDYLQHPDIGYALMPEYAGAGYAHEAATAVLKFAYDTLHHTMIHAIVTPDNERSVHLLKKLGFSFDKEIMDGGNTLLLFNRAADAENA